MDRVNEITNEVFTAVAQIRRADERSYPMPEVLHGRMRSFVDGAMRRAADLGFTQHDVHDIGYVLVALIDEVVVAKGGELREFWLPRLLQLQYFNENVAGEGVFDRLQALLHDPSRVEVLKVYYMVLLFGFQGKYRVRGGEMELADVTDRVAETLRRSGHMGEVELSPEGARPRERGGGVGRNLPLIAISVAALVFALIVYLGLQLTITSRAGNVVERIQQSSQTLQ
jgi:type VI secretion system protein ImpK